MTTKIRLEISPLATKNISGVGNYTRLLSDALASTPDVAYSGVYFNFLHRQPKPAISKGLELTRSLPFPLRIYSKLQSHGIAPPFDIFLPRTDLTIFTNFATWPTIRSRKRATVIHDLTFLYFPETVEEKNLRHLKRVVPRSIRKADFIITVSEAVKDELVHNYGLESKKCIVTPIPPDPIFFDILSKDQIRNVKVKYGLNTAKEYFYFIGNREPRKNLKVLIEAYEKLPVSVKNTYPLVIAGGKGWKSEDTDVLIKSAINKGADIKLIGYIDQADSPALYQGARLAFLPSLYEGFGMPITEACASGCQVIASDIPVLREAGGAEVLYANPLSSDSFRQTIEQALLLQPSVENLQRSVRHLSWLANIYKIIDAIS